MLRVVLAWLSPGVVLCALSLACGPTAAPAEPSPSADAFAVVRATSQAAYQAGQSALASGDYLQACVDLDTAKTNDPDNRPEIQQALEQALSRCLTPPPTQTISPPAVAQQRTIVVATLAAGVGGALSASTTPPPATLAAPPLSVPTPAVNTPAAGGTPSGQAANAVASPAATAATRLTPGAPAANASLAMWNDPEGRFSIGAPSNWQMVTPPQSLVGTSVVEFHDPSGAVEVDVAVDSAAKAVSPELYAASLEIAMQQQVPGYAGEQVVPGTTANSPSVQRVFTFTEYDASGQDHQARGFQQTVIKGQTPYIISGSAPAEQYQQFSPTFDQIVSSFRFS